MDNFSFRSPTHFEFGGGAEAKTAELIKQFAGVAAENIKVLFVYGGGSIKSSGLYDRIKTTLAEGNINFIELGGVEANPKDTKVYEGIELARKEGLNFILAAGGGSVIDTGKAIAAGALYDGDFWDFYEGKPVEKALPVGTILTIAAAGSEGSKDAVIVKTTNLPEGVTPKKHGASGECLRPVFSVLNPELTQTLPPYQTAAGCADIMQHVMERYFSNTAKVEVTDRLCEALLTTIITEAPRVLFDPNDYDARANIMWAGMVAHNNICGVGRAQDWACHNLEHEISAKYGTAHGAGLAAIVPHWARFVCDKNPNKFVQFAVRVFGVQMHFDNLRQTAFEGIDRLANFLKSIGMPEKISQLGVTESDISIFADRLIARKGGGSGAYVRLGRDEIITIYKNAL